MQPGAVSQWRQFPYSGGVYVADWHPQVVLLLSPTIRQRAVELKDKKISLGRAGRAGRRALIRLLPFFFLVAVSRLFVEVRWTQEDAKPWATARQLMSGATFGGHAQRAEVWLPRQIFCDWATADSSTSIACAVTIVKKTCGMRQFASDWWGSFSVLMIAIAPGERLLEQFLRDELFKTFSLFLPFFARFFCATVTRTVDRSVTRVHLS